MSPEKQLEDLRRAVIAWAKSRTYEEGCRNWSRLSAMVGIDK